jgi:beta-lactamase regulating signal transducer with metallopeptidase domain
MVEQLNAIARLWWGWSAAMFWQVGLLILLIAAIDRLIRRWAWPQLRYALWSLILVKLLLPPWLSLPSGIVPGLQPVVKQALVRLEPERPPAVESHALFSLNEDMFEVCSVPVRASRSTGILPVRGPQTHSFASGGASSMGGTPMNLTDMHGQDARDTHGRDGRATELDDTTHAGPLMWVAWQVYAMMASLAGTLILGIWLFFRLHSLIGRHAQEVAAASLPQSFYNQLADCARRLELRCIPRVVVTGRLATPAVFGVFRPVLLMPKGYLGKLSRRDTEHMLLHELAHIKRGDLLAHGLYMLLQVVYWYNPLLWLVRRQMHHLRELSCDATVAELLRERTPAYRQTLLDTARRLLTSSVEPGLGLLGLFEDSNRLLVRLNWLTKPTWRYRTMKRVTVATIAALMFACVLPMAQARESVSHEHQPPAVQEPQQASQDPSPQEIAALEARLHELMLQQRQLQEQLRALAERREIPRESRERPTVQPRHERTPQHVEVAPTRPGGSPAGGRVTQPVPPAPPHIPEGMSPEAREQIRHAYEQVRRAQQEAAHAQQDARKALAETERARVQEHQQVRHLEAWGKQLEQWERGEEMQKWQRDMEEWGEQMERWGQVLARRQRAADGSQTPEAAPMPPMPSMPPMPAMPPMPDVSVGAPVVPAPPHAGVPPVRPPAPPVPVPQVAPTPPVPPVAPATPARPQEPTHVVPCGDFAVRSLPDGAVLQVDNHIGAIAVEGTESRDATITATATIRGVDREEAEQIARKIAIQVAPGDGHVRVRAQLPEGLDEEQRSRIAIAYRIAVPRETRVQAVQRMGDVSLASLLGDVRAAVEVGSIQARDLEGGAVLRTKVGNINFATSRDLSASVHARTQVGSISSNLPLEITGATVVQPGDARTALGSHARGTLGGGQNKIDLTAEVGSIQVRRDPAGRATGVR